MDDELEVLEFPTCYSGESGIGEVVIQHGWKFDEDVNGEMIISWIGHQRYVGCKRIDIEGESLWFCFMANTIHGISSIPPVDVPVELMVAYIYESALAQEHDAIPVYA